MLSKEFIEKRNLRLASYDNYLEYYVRIKELSNEGWVTNRVREVRKAAKNVIKVYLSRNVCVPEKYEDEKERIKGMTPSILAYAAIVSMYDIFEKYGHIVYAGPRYVGLLDVPVAKINDPGRLTELGRSNIRRLKELGDEALAAFSASTTDAFSTDDTEVLLCRALAKLAQAAVPPIFIECVTAAQREAVPATYTDYLGEDVLMHLESYIKLEARQVEDWALREKREVIREIKKDRELRRAANPTKALGMPTINCLSVVHGKDAYFNKNSTNVFDGLVLKPEIEERLAIYQLHVN